MGSVIILHLVVVISLIGTILLQRPEDGALGLGGGGGGGNMTGSHGSPNALTRMTMILAALFFLISIFLALVAKRSIEVSIFDTVPLASSSSLDPHVDGPSVPAPSSSLDPHVDGPSVPAPSSSLDPHVDGPSVPAPSSSLDPHVDGPSVPAPSSSLDPHVDGPSVPAPSSTKDVLRAKLKGK